MLARVKQSMPWWMKMAVKSAVWCIPIPGRYKFLSQAGVFKLGQMRDYNYAFGVFFERYKRVDSCLPLGWVCLELGPGDSLATAISAYAMGAGKTYLIDVGPLALMEIKWYRGFIEFVAEKRCARDVRPLLNCQTMGELMEATGARYLTRGLRSFAHIPTASVDFAFSCAVLEHVALDEMRPLFQELGRVIKPGGVMVHWIDFRDHLAFSLHSLRFSRRLWENPVFRNAGFYTNRLRYGSICFLATEAGFEVKGSYKTWPVLPIPMNRIHSEFRGRSDLHISEAEIICVRRPRHERE